MSKNIKQKIFKKPFLVAIFVLALVLAGAVIYGLYSRAATTVTHTVRVQTNGSYGCSGGYISSADSGYPNICKETTITPVYNSGSKDYYAHENPGYDLSNWRYRCTNCADTSWKTPTGLSTSFSVSSTQNWEIEAIFVLEPVTPSCSINSFSATGGGATANGGGTLTGTAPFSVTFNKSIANATGSTINYGDGTSSTSFSPHTYPAGTYNAVAVCQPGGATSAITINSVAAPPPPSYSLTTGVLPSGAGSVSKNPNAASYVSGTNVTLNAVAASGYTFSNWTNCSTSASNPLTINVNSNKTCIANFKSSSGGGNSGGGTTGGGTTNPISNTINHYIPSIGGTSEEQLAADDTEAPSTPTNLTGQYDQEKMAVSLTWVDSTDNTRVKEYEIERTEKDVDGWAKIGTSETAGYSDPEVIAEVIYQYRVRAVDIAGNTSDYSNVVEVTAGQFIPNVTAAEGGTVYSDDGFCSVEFTPNSISEDAFVLVEKVKKTDLSLSQKKYKLLTDVCQIRARNIKGEEITTFKSQIKITIKFSPKAAKGIKKDTIKIASQREDGTLEFMITAAEAKRGEASALSEHFSYFFVTAEKTNNSIWAVLGFVIGITAFLAIGYFIWRWYRTREFQEEHREDYIYKH